MNRSERQAEKLAALVAAFYRGLRTSDQPEAIPAPATLPDESMLQILDEERAQREHIFAFGVIASVFDRGIEQISATTTRIGLLIAAQIAIEAALIVKGNEYAVGPNLLILGNIIATALLFRATGGADGIAVEPFAKAFAAHPVQTRAALVDQLRAAIARNSRLARSQQRLLSGTLLVTIVALSWAFW